METIRERSRDYTWIAAHSSRAVIGVCCQRRHYLQSCPILCSVFPATRNDSGADCCRVDQCKREDSILLLDSSVVWCSRHCWLHIHESPSKMSPPLAPRSSQWAKVASQFINKIPFGKLT